MHATPLHTAISQQNALHAASDTQTSHISFEVVKHMSYMCSVQHMRLWSLSTVKLFGNAYGGPDQSVLLLVPTATVS